MTTTRFVTRLPDLIRPEEYASDPEGRRIKFRIRVTPNGLEVLGDSMNPGALDLILGMMDPTEIQKVLCG